MLEALSNASSGLENIRDPVFAILDYTDEETIRTPALPSLLNLPLPRPPAKTCAFTTEGASVTEKPREKVVNGLNFSSVQINLEKDTTY